MGPRAVDVPIKATNSTSHESSSFASAPGSTSSLSVSPSSPRTLMEMLSTDRVGVYRLVKLLGKNTFDFSYLAEPCNRLDRKRRFPVVIKLLRGRRAQDPRLFEAIKARLSSASRAPVGARVVRLVDAWREEASSSLGGCYCLATAPYCSGGLLEEVVKKRPYSYDLHTALRWCKEVCETLHLLHSVRVYHGTMGPRDVLLRARAEGGWEAYVRGLDGGLKEEEARALTASMAPEWREVAAAAEDGGTIGDEAREKADVWSLGTLMWCLLSRSLPDEKWANVDQAWHALLRMGPSSSSLAVPGSWEADLRAQWEEEEGGLPLGVLQLLRLCLSERRQRPSMLQVLGRLSVLLSAREATGVGAGVVAEREAMEVILRRTKSPGVTNTSVEESASSSSLSVTTQQEQQQHEDEQGEVEKRPGSRSSSPPILTAAPSATTAGTTKAGSDMSWSTKESIINNFTGLLTRSSSSSSSSSSSTTIPTTTAAPVTAAASYEAEQQQQQRRKKHPSSSSLAGLDNSTSPSRMASTLSNLASASTAKGEYAQAVSLYEEVLDLRRSVLPYNHPDITTTVMNLASLYRMTGEVDRALPLYQEALDLRRKALPPGHHDIVALVSTLTDLSNHHAATPVVVDSL